MCNRKLHGIYSTTKLVQHPSEAYSSCHFWSYHGDRGGARGRGCQTLSGNPAPYWSSIVREIWTLILKG